MNNLECLEGKKILFLQGPMGTFFKKLDDNFRKRGGITYHIGFNMGDQFFAHKCNYTGFREDCKNWPMFIKDFLQKKQINMIFLFGDCRYYQRVTTVIARANGIDIFVFEEGYLRPHYITMERFGVNGFSQLSRDPAFYISNSIKSVSEPEHAQNSKSNMIISAILYYALSNLFVKIYPNYRHHREFSAIKEAFYGIRGACRKLLYIFTERGYLDKLTGALSKKYYFVPLQTHSDFQIRQHSNYRSIEKFIIEVLESFAQNAPKGTFLVFKHHPVDRGRKNYHTFIMEQAKILKIKYSIIVIHDVFLPTILNHAKGTITINSTVGLTSIKYGIPTIALGDAIYDMEGLTNTNKDLNEFWCDPKKPDSELYRKFSQFLIQNTQLNGSFYGCVPKELQ